MAEAVAACSVRNTPPGSAQAALLARVNGISEDRVSTALLDKTLVEVHGPRMVPALVRREDLAVFTLGCISADDASLHATIGKLAGRRLDEAGIRPGEALTLVVDAALAELAGGARAKGELSAALTARLPESMSAWCERCGSRHIDENLFRLPGAVGAYCIAPRSAREVWYVRVDEWLGADVPAVGSAAARDAGRELLRRFLRCYGPATPEGFAYWSLIGVDAAQRRFTELAGDLQEVSWDGATGSILRADVDDLKRAQPPAGVRLLPPSDPYVLCRDRATLVPDPARRKAVWPALGAPGTLVVDGEIVAIWRAQKKSRTLRAQVAFFERPMPEAATLIEEEAQLIAVLRGCHTAEVTID
jgi:hypothetical protein